MSTVWIALRWIVGSILFAFGAWVIVSNAIGVARSTREHGYSSIPFFGGLLAAGAMLTLPIAPLHRWWWVGFLVDVYSVPGVVMMIVSRIRGGRRG